MTGTDMGWSQIGIRICLIFVAIVIGSTFKRPRRRNHFVHRHPRAPLAQPHHSCDRRYIP